MVKNDKARIQRNLTFLLKNKALGKIRKANRKIFFMRNYWKGRARIYPSGHSIGY
jgi:hypothetical protein